MSRSAPGSRTVTVLMGTVFALGLGEELWQAYLPAYISALGGTAVVVGLFGSCRDLLDGLYQLPGGYLADRVGPRRAIATFTAIALGGYAAYALAWSWPVALVGLAGAMAWKAAAFPATFSMIGESLPAGDRVRGFTRQSVAVRVPRVISAPIGGLIVWQFGLDAGVRVALALTMALAVCALVAQRRAWFARTGAERPRPAPALRLFAPLPRPLVRLLAADALVRIGEGIAATFVVLYVTGVRHVPLPAFGLLYALQQAVALASYHPAGRLTMAIGARPLVALTFACFALFPLTLLWAPGPAGLIGAFLVGGLKEFGEPARKSAIVDLCRAESRGREIGVYYTIRNLLVVPAGIVGGMLWRQSPTLVLEAAGAVSAIGLIVFMVNRADLNQLSPTFERRDRGDRRVL